MTTIQGGARERQVYGDDHLAINFQEQAVWLDQQPMRLTRKEFELLALLVHNAGQTVARETLLEQVWGYSREIRTRTLDVHVRRVRKNLGPYAERYIETIFGIGYRFQPFRGRPYLHPGADPAALALGA
jgi:DNA-binding response OmpR family regulator